MVTDSEKDEMCSQASFLWGIQNQIFMVIEELAELTFTICKFDRSQKTAADVAEEIADVRIMSRQLMHMLGITEEDVQKVEAIKWARLGERIEVSKEKRRMRGKE